MKNTNSQNPLINKLRDEFCSIVRERGLTQLDVVAATGISQSQLSFFMNKKRNLNGDAALRLLAFIEHQKDMDGALHALDA